MSTIANTDETAPVMAEDDRIMVRQFLPVITPMLVGLVAAFGANPAADSVSLACGVLTVIMVLRADWKVPGFILPFACVEIGAGITILGAWSGNLVACGG
jgi:hypothetical protein